MIFRRDKSPIDGEKLNKLLLDIRSGKSKYIEFEIQDLVKKSSWRKYHPPKWSWIFGTALFIFEIFSSATSRNGGSSVGFFLSIIFFLVPFIGMTIANVGYKSFNQLKSILDRHIQ